METYQRVRMVRWVRLFGRTIIWSQRAGLRSHGFYYNGRQMMYTFCVIFRPFRIWCGKAW